MADLNDLIRKGIFDIELDTSNPNISGYSAGDGAMGRGLDGSRWIKVGPNDTDWEKILLTTDGSFVANIELGDASEIVLGNNVIGEVNGQIAIGDGVKTAGNRLITKANEGDTHTIGNFSFVGNSNGVMELTNVPADSATVINIPFTWFPVEIPNNKFAGYVSITGIHLPNSIIKIGNSAFTICTSITELNIPDSVQEIGNNAFDTCINVTSLTLSNNITTIGSFAFRSCSSITGTLTLPDKLKTIGSSAFSNCSSITSLAPITSKSLKIIPTGCFFGCSLSGNLTLPENLEQINESAFRDNDLSGTLILPDTLKSIGQSSFVNNNFTGQLVIPDSVTNISFPDAFNSNAFAGCSGLTSLVTGSSLDIIGSTAFRGCSGLTYAIFKSISSSFSIQSSAFENCTNLTDLYVGSSDAIGVFQQNSLLNSGVTTIHVRPNTNWTLGPNQTLGNKSGITVVDDWVNYPNI